MCVRCTLCVVKWVHVRSEVMCVLQYLGSGSWARPSGSRRSRRSEACNYWSPHGPLWGRYGSSDVCCSCSNAQEFIYLFFSWWDLKHVCIMLCMHLSPAHIAELFLVWTAWDNSPTGDGEKPCVQQATHSKGTAASWDLIFSPNNSRNKLGQKICSSKCPPSV